MSNWVNNTMYTIRDFDYSDDDYRALVTVRNSARPDSPRSEEEWRYSDSSMNPDFAYHRDFVLANGEVVAFGVYGQDNTSFHPQKYYWRVTAHPDHAKTAIYATYFEHILKALADKNLIALMVDALTNWTTKIDYLQSQGFKETMRFNISQLDVNAFDLSQWSTAEQRVTDQDIRIRSLSEIMPIDPQWEHKLYELDWLINRDMPSPEPPVKSTFEHFQKANTHHPKFDPDFWFIATHDDEFIGFTQFWSNRDDKDLLKTGDSGVIRAYRRKGVVTALKVHAIRFTQAIGVPRIRTANAAINPMYQINVKLGFKLMPSWIDFEKLL